MRRAQVVFLVAFLFAPCVAWPQGGMPVGPEFRVNTYTTNYQFDSAVAFDGAGNFVVVWESREQDGSQGGVFGQRYATSGTPLGPEFRVNTVTVFYQNEPAVAAAASGDFVVVWASPQQDGSLSGVFGQRYAGSGAPSDPEFRVNTYTTSGQNLPAVAADPSGNFVVVWSSNGQDGSSLGVFGQRYASSGAPLGTEFRVNTFTTNYQRFASVASDSAGNFVVVWEDQGQDGSLAGVFGQRYASSGVAVAPEFRVNTYTTNVQYRPVVAMGASGEFVVVWMSRFQDGAAAGVFAQRYDGSGTAVGPEFRVNTYTTGGQYSPVVASDAAGNFLVVWSSPEASADGVFGQRYAVSGAPLGAEFQVNTYTTNRQYRPTAAADASGNFVVTWSSQQDGSLLGVFGQRYSPILPVELTGFRVE
jgi:hypothetical protein